MKNIFIYVNLIFALQLNAQTNVYHPMLSDTSVEWIYADEPFPNTHFYGRVRICGTMTYSNNQVYKVLCVDEFQGTGNPYTLINQDTIILAREDVQNKKVYGLIKPSYFYDPLPSSDHNFDPNEKLLYDFDSLYIGKPLNTFYQTRPGMSYPDTVKCIDSTQLLDGTYRLFFTNGGCQVPPDVYTLSNDPGTIICGIGNITNPFLYWGFQPNLTYPPFFPHRTLLCYKKNNLVLWQNQYYQLFAPADICNFVLKTDDIQRRNTLLKLFPTIASDYLYIYPPVKDGNLCVEIYSTSGQLVSKWNNNPSTYFDIRYINDGFYLVKINYKGHTSYHKIIVKH